MSEATQVQQRKDIPDQYKWDLSALFKTDEDWDKELEELKKIAGEMSAFEGHLGDDADTLLAFLQKNDAMNFHATRLYVYANMHHHEDTGVTKYQSLSAKADDILVLCGSATSFMTPEILAIPEEKLASFLAEEKLAPYKRMIDEILRAKPHTLSQKEEALLAEVGSIAVGPDNIYSIFANADLKFPVITDVEGNKIQVTHGNYISLMQSTDRKTRKQAFEALYHTYQKFGNTIATTYVAHLKQDLFYAKARNYASTRAMHLDSGNVPEEVYDNLIATVHKHLPDMHRYAAIRKKMLGVEELHMYDMYVPLVDEGEQKFTFEEAKEVVAKALAPMGEEYVSILREGYDNGWIDAFENANKRSGAYSWGAYGTHPYVFLNHKENLDSVFTLAHEMGHAIHTYYSNKTQPFTYAEYLIFVAEVASTCNEALLGEYLLKNTTDKAQRLALINQKLEGFRGTIFRQTMFAEFEMIAHRRLQNGESLTKEDLNAIYRKLNEEYFGPDVVIDEEIDSEWMRIPHFYTPFYVYQYATGYSAATAFSKMILEEGEPAVKRYVENFLCGGSSKDPIDLLKAAGVDMSSPKPVDDALNVFAEYLEMFEKEQ